MTPLGTDHGATTDCKRCVVLYPGPALTPTDGNLLRSVIWNQNGGAANLCHWNPRGIFRGWCGNRPDATQPLCSAQCGGTQACIDTCIQAIESLCNGYEVSCPGW